MKYSECKTEQAFKMEWIRRNRKNFMEIFCIETEETVKGFPDVLAIEENDHCNQTPYFVEFKKADNNSDNNAPVDPENDPLNQLQDKLNEYQDLGNFDEEDCPF